MLPMGLLSPVCSSFKYVAEKLCLKILVFAKISLKHQFQTCNESLGHLSHSGDLMLWIGVRCLSSVNNFFSITTWSVFHTTTVRKHTGNTLKKTLCFSLYSSPLVSSLLVLMMFPFGFRRPFLRMISTTLYVILVETLWKMWNYLTILSIQKPKRQARLITLPIVTWNAVLHRRR